MFLLCVFCCLWYYIVIVSKIIFNSDLDVIEKCICSCIVVNYLIDISNIFICIGMIVKNWIGLLVDYLEL